VTILAVSSQVLVQNVIDGIALGCLYALLAIGLALIFGVLGLLNWAYGELIMVGGYVLVILSSIFLPLLIPLMVLVVVLVALVMERVAFRPVRRASAETMLITSFGVSFLLQSLALLIFGQNGRSANVASGLLRPVDVLGVSVARLDIVIVGVGGVLLGGLAVMLWRTTLGIQLRAAAQDFEVAQMLGVRANRVIAVAFALSGISAGAAALLLTIQTGVVTPTFGLTPVVIAFVAVILGGMGSLTGGALGGLIVGALSVAFQALLPESLRPYREAFLYTVVFIMLTVRPQGLILASHRIDRV
jgi:branched-chain amino acid transport system permease protein